MERPIVEPMAIPNMRPGSPPASPSTAPETPPRKALSARMRSFASLDRGDRVFPYRLLAVRLVTVPLLRLQRTHAGFVLFP